MVNITETNVNLSAKYRISSTCIITDTNRKHNFCLKSTEFQISSTCMITDVKETSNVCVEYNTLPGWLLRYEYRKNNLIMFNLKC
jgi:hypothetical protein